MDPVDKGQVKTINHPRTRVVVKAQTKTLALLCKRKVRKKAQGIAIMQKKNQQKKTSTGGREGGKAYKGGINRLKERGKDANQEQILPQGRLAEKMGRAVD